MSIIPLTILPIVNLGNLDDGGWHPKWPNWGFSGVLCTKRQLLGGVATAFGRSRDSFWAESRQLLGGVATAFGRSRDSFWAESRQLLGGVATAFGRKVDTRGEVDVPPGAAEWPTPGDTQRNHASGPCTPSGKVRDNGTSGAVPSPSFGRVVRLLEKAGPAARFGPGMPLRDFRYQ